MLKIALGCDHGGLELKEDIFKISSIISSHLLQDVLFSLLSGRCIVIVSTNYNSACAFAKKLSILYPFIRMS